MNTPIEYKAIIEKAFENGDWAPYAKEDYEAIIPETMIAFGQEAVWCEHCMYAIYDYSGENIVECCGPCQCYKEEDVVMNVMTGLIADKRG